MDKLIYICHQYGGLKQNEIEVERIVKRLVKKYPNYCFISPIHALGYLYNMLPYDKGMEHCLTLLDMCDEMWVFGSNSMSKGCMIEKDYCNQHKIPITDMSCEVCAWNKKRECGVDFCVSPHCMK